MQEKKKKDEGVKRLDSGENWQSPQVPAISSTWRSTEGKQCGFVYLVVGQSQMAELLIWKVVVSTWYPKDK